MFGLTNGEGNHGEDVKEYYFYLDLTPTHSYMKMLYKYPQAAYPYNDLVATNAQRGRGDMEYELLDTGVFNGGRYFDVFVEYAKKSPTDILIQISVVNRGPEPAVVHVIPTIWFRNFWSWWPDLPKPSLRKSSVDEGVGVAASDHEIGEYVLHCENSPPLLFTENETNNERVFGVPNATRYVKDGINEFIVGGRTDSVNPDQLGTKAAAHYHREVGAAQTSIVRLRLVKGRSDAKGEPFGREFDQIMALRRQEADSFYKAITPDSVGDDAANVMRQALAGMLWSKQYYFFDLAKWLSEHGADPRGAGGHETRNCEWLHMVNDSIISMPDKWEYPWFAAWDLAFHAMALATVDLDFAKQQIDLMLDTFYHASDRTDAGLRVELQRRQSSGPRLGNDLSVQH